MSIYRIQGVAYTIKKLSTYEIYGSLSQNGGRVVVQEDHVLSLIRPQKEERQAGNQLK